MRLRLFSTLAWLFRLNSELAAALIIDLAQRLTEADTGQMADYLRESKALHQRERERREREGPPVHQNCRCQLPSQDYPTFLRSDEA